MPNIWHYKYGDIYRNKNIMKNYPQSIIDILKENINNFTNN